jgi:hypothetical protein
VVCVEIFQSGNFFQTINRALTKLWRIRLILAAKTKKAAVAAFYNHTGGKKCAD